MQQLKSVTVFGGDGFIGRYVVRELAKTGAMVQVACRHLQRAKRCQPSGDVGQITPIYCDIRDDVQVRKALRTADAAVNLTGILYEKGRNSFTEVHHKGAKNVAEICRQLGINKLVHLSALGASEKSISKYARSKAQGERAVFRQVPEAVVLRPSIVFGSEDNFFNRFAVMAKISPALPLIGEGRTMFQPVYVDDVARAVVAGLTDPTLAGQIYELGGPKTYSYKELMELILKEIGADRSLVNVPFGLASFKAWFAQFMPDPLITPDQVRLLKVDNIVGNSAKMLGDMGVAPTALEMILPTYLYRFRDQGPWANTGSNKAAA